jgi:glycosyltransferase involved in cell wall biosynthesis
MVRLASEDDCRGELAQLGDTIRLTEGVAAAGDHDVVLVNGIYSAEIERRIVSGPAVLFAQNYYGTCISGEKRHQWPSPACCERVFGPACVALYVPRRCGPLRPGAAFYSGRLQLARSRLLGSYRRIVVASEHMRLEFERHVPGRVTRIPFFAPEDRPPPVQRSKAGFVFVGRMTNSKGVQLLVDAALELARETGIRPKISFVGDGPERSRTKRAADAAGIETQWMGWRPPVERDEVVRKSCALLLPSVWPEPFGLVGLEAARLGVPTVAFDVGGISDWLTDGVNGALVPLRGNLPAEFARGMARAMHDLESGGAWGAGARRRADEFTIERHVQALSTLLRGVAESSR